MLRFDLFTTGHLQDLRLLIDSALNEGMSAEDMQREVNAEISKRRAAQSTQPKPFGPAGKKCPSCDRSNLRKPNWQGRPPELAVLVCPACRYSEVVT